MGCGYRVCVLRGVARAHIREGKGGLACEGRARHMCMLMKMAAMSIRASASCVHACMRACVRLAHA